MTRINDISINLMQSHASTLSNQLLERQAAEHLRLGAGLRINTASDDTAGVSIADRMRAQGSTLNMGIRNAQNGTSMLQTANGSLDEMGSMLLRMRTLASSAASETATEQDRGLAQVEYDRLTDGLSYIAQNTTFGGSTLLARGEKDGLLNHEVKIDLGDSATEDFSLDVSKELDAMRSAIRTAAGNFNDGTGTRGINAGQELMSGNAAGTVDLLDKAIESVGAAMAAIGGGQGRLDQSIGALAMRPALVNNPTATRAREDMLKDAEEAQRAAQLAKEQIMSQAGANVLSQANQLPAVALQMLRR